MCDSLDRKGLRAGRDRAVSVTGGASDAASRSRNSPSLSRPSPRSPEESLAFAKKTQKSHPIRAWRRAATSNSTYLSARNAIRTVFDPRANVTRSASGLIFTIRRTLSKGESRASATVSLSVRVVREVVCRFPFRRALSVGRARETVNRGRARDLRFDLRRRYAGELTCQFPPAIIINRPLLSIRFSIRARFVVGAERVKKKEHSRVYDVRAVKDCRTQRINPA